MNSLHDNSDHEKTIIRTKKNKNYSVIYNEVARRADISARAKGLYFYIMTLPDDWQIYKTELYKHFTEGRDALNKAFKELEDAGYITKEKSKNVNGKFDGWNYTVIESIQNLQSSDTLKNRQSEKPKSVNPPLLSTEFEVNTNNTNGGEEKLLKKIREEYPEITRTDTLMNSFTTLLETGETVDTLAQHIVDLIKKKQPSSAGGWLTSQVSNIDNFIKNFEAEKAEIEHVQAEAAATQEYLKEMERWDQEAKETKLDDPFKELKEFISNKEAVAC